ncbi:uncharacterized protein LOC131223691 isoform X2 [Magnolia sinica]|uniref:uncharacterized protein LOC131223691 isoform X2 n=1 Tax=Magnolia sinica TaxID=86752 RepID=UPI00265864FA|nr:uncharacterized protein LOC131223691 isoform X2 [Magnolia sinica]
MIRLLFLVALIHRVSVYAVSGSCELSVFHGSSLYNFSLTRPSPKYPHGVLSEDGFYKVSVNETLLWFQLCDRMIFNHDPPGCFDCQDCGGPLHCGMKCSALVANNIGGYYVCAAIGKASNSDITLIDKNDPQKGVTVKMSTSVLESNCSLSVSVFCDSKGILGPYSLNRSGDCNYATELRHPSGCATIISIRGRGWRWFGTLITMYVLYSFPLLRTFMPLRRVSTCWNSLSVFFPRSSWYRSCSKFGVLAQFTTKSSEFSHVFGEKI